MSWFAALTMTPGSVQIYETTARRWNRFWFRSVPPHALALLRIVLGSFLLLYWGLKCRAVPLLFSSNGLILPYFESQSVAFAFLQAPPPAAAWIIFSVFCVCLVLFTLGWHMRISAAVVTILYAYYMHLSLYLFGTSFDRLFLFMMLVFTFSGADKTFSLAMRVFRGSIFAWEPISILPQRLLAVQITATYGGVGWQKLILPVWQDGQVLFHGFIGRWSTRFSFALARLPIPMPVYDAAIFLIKCLEVAMPIGLWIPRWQWLFFLGGALFHIGIAILMGIWWFLALIPCYILFLDPDEVYRFLKERSRGRIP